MVTVGQIQLGKNGVTENFILTLGNHFKKHNIIKVSVLKGAGHERDKVKEYAEKILEGLGAKFTTKIIGFTIIVKKWRRDQR